MHKWEDKVAKIRKAVQQLIVCLHSHVVDVTGISPGGKQLGLEPVHV
jgi:hypothetical protein